MKIKKYWCDPDDGLTSRFIKNIGLQRGDVLDVTFEDGMYTEVYLHEIIDVLLKQDNVTLEDIIDTEFDWDVYLHHAGFIEFKYKSFILAIMGEQSTFLNGERIFKSPELVLEHKDKLDFGDSCWIEIVNSKNFDEEYDVCGSLREAVDTIDGMKG